MRYLKYGALFAGTTSLLLACGTAEPEIQIISDAQVLDYPDQAVWDSYTIEDPLVAEGDGGQLQGDGNRSLADGTPADAADQPGGCEPTGEVEQCANAVDDDCNGFVDSQDPACQRCPPQGSQACTTGQPGVCAAGNQACELKEGGIWDWGACSAEVEPGGKEICDNGLDNDCDGLAPADDPNCYCSNGKRDKDETDVDCGGSCGPCDKGKLCDKAKDCKSNRCLPPSISGGCGGGFGSKGKAIDYRSGRLQLRCEQSSWNSDDVRSSWVPLTVVGITASGGCTGGTRATHNSVSGGKLMAHCEGGFPARETTQEIRLNGATLSGSGCSTAGLEAQGSMLLLECYKWSWSDPDGQGRPVQSRVLISGDKTCQ